VKLDDELEGKRN